LQIRRINECNVATVSDFSKKIEKTVKREKLLVVVVVRERVFLISVQQ
jgi:hypothetical protein